MPSKTPSTQLQRPSKQTKLTIPERELIYQTWLAMGNQSAVARALGVSKLTVHNTIKAMEAKLPPKKVQEAREQMATTLTGRYHEQVVAILDSIKPEDIESGRIPIKNAKGDITGYTHFGPRLVEKATAAAIFTDKIRVLRDYEKAIGQDQQAGQLPMPESVEQLVSGIKNQIQSIQLLNVNFKQSEPELATRIEQVMPAEAAEVLSGVSGELDFRNPE